jgi:conjugative transfer signal peptidase TraF
MQEAGAVEAGRKEVGRSVWVVGQDKESGSLWPVARDFLRRRASFFAGYRDLHGVTVTRDAGVAMTRAITAPRRARRKPFGPSGWPARRVAAALVLGLVALGVPAALGRVFKIRITLTDSAAPAGIYRLAKDAPVERGELVATCLPPAIARAGLARGYLRRGDCPAGAEPVAKVIGALPGDVLTVERGQVAVDGVRFADSRTAAHDSSGRPLPHVRWGARRVAPGEVWLFGFNDPRSWDARYFEAIPLVGVNGVLRPVLTW